MSSGGVLNTCWGHICPLPRPAPPPQSVPFPCQPRGASRASGLAGVSLQQISIVVERFKSSKSNGSCGDHSVYCYDCFNLVLVSPHSPFPRPAPPLTALTPTAPQSPLISTYKRRCLHCYPHKQHVSTLSPSPPPPLRRGAQGSLCPGNATPISTLCCRAGGAVSGAWAGRGRAGHRLVVWG